MSHFVGLVLLSLAVAVVFTFINYSDPRARFIYFFKLLAAMVLGSLVFAWLMYFIP